MFVLDVHVTVPRKNQNFLWKKKHFWHRGLLLVIITRTINIKSPNICAYFFYYVKKYIQNAEIFGISQPRCQNKYAKTGTPSSAELKILSKFACFKEFCKIFSFLAIEK